MNVQHLKSVRKTDVQDTEWIADLDQPLCYILDRDQRELFNKSYQSSL